MANSPTSHPIATQESIFDETTDSATLEAYESDYDNAENSLFDAAEDLSDDALDPFTVEEDHPIVTETASEAASESVETSIHADERHPEPAQQSTSAEGHAAPAPETAAEPAPEAPSILTVDDFAALEERIIRAVGLVRSERQARIAAEERASILEAEVQEQIPAIERLQREIDGLRAEREQVRQRVERLLGQLDALEL